MHLTKILDQASITRLKNAADAAQALENAWMQKLAQKFEEINEQVVDHIKEYGRPPTKIDFADFYMQHSFEAMALGIRTAHTLEQNKEVPYAVSAQLAGVPPKGKVPRAFRDLMAAWDHWRKTGKILPRQKALADKIAKRYLQKVQSVWEKQSRDFRTGKEWTQQEVLNNIREAGDTTYSRAKTIVQTETTYYYNKARRQIYDQSGDVTHYLFVPIRDSATTKWCSTRQGLVYRKGDEILEKETPPIHWNCRSEVLPLTPQNPKHLALINDKSRDRRRHSPAPLPKGWNKRVA